MGEGDGQQRPDPKLQAGCKLGDETIHHVMVKVRMP